MDDLDRILLSEDEATPSPDFQASVMRAVRRRARTPAPIPFPWRVLTESIVGLSLLSAVLVPLVPASWREAVAAARDLLPSEPSGLVVLGWIALALLASSILPLVSFDLAQD